MHYNYVVQDWGEFSKLADLANLAELTFYGNPLEIQMQNDGDYQGTRYYVYSLAK